MKSVSDNKQFETQKLRSITVSNTISNDYVNISNTVTIIKFINV